MLKDILYEIHLFIEGVASICDDSNIIVKKASKFFGKKYKTYVKYVLMMKTQLFTAKQFANIISLRDFFEGLSDPEIECAKRNGLVIVYGYSDDLIELKGAIQAEGECFEGGDFHLIKEDGKWKLVRGEGVCNTISAKWYNRLSLTDNGDIIPWSYETDISHEKFLANNGGDIFCEGFVFNVKDLSRQIEF